MRRHTWMYLIAAFVLAGGCAGIEAPEGYVALRQPKPYEFKAVSARGNVIALSSRPNENASADLDFWTEAVEHQKVDLDGMELAGREPIQTEGGLEGVLFHFQLGEGQGQVSYLVSLYVTPHRIYTVEAGGPADQIAADLDKLRQAMRSLRP